MGNLFTAIAAPAGNGAGAAVDVSAYGAKKTFTVANLATAHVTIEISNQATPTHWAPIWTFTIQGEQTFEFAALWVRARVSNYAAGGAPVVNLAGNDDGATAAVLIAPSGNGDGAWVDVSSLPELKTVHVGGPFTGSVQIEMSADGGVTPAGVYSFQNPGQETMVFTANRMRVSRNGVAGGGTPTVNVMATVPGGGGSGGSSTGGEISASNVLTFRPGSTETGPVVFNDFDDLYAQLVSLRTAAKVSGRYTIIFDDADGAVVVPGSAYDMTDTEWAGAHGPTTFNPVTVTITDGAAITHLLGITGLGVTKTVVGTPPIAVGAGEVLTIAMATIYAGSAGMEPIGTSGAFALIRLEDLGILGSFALAINAGANTGLMLQGGASAANDDSIAGDGSTTLTTYIQSSTAEYGTFSGFSGTEIIQQFPAAWYWNRGDPNTFVSGNLGTSLVDSTTGNVWNNSDGSTGWTLSAASSVAPQMIHGIPLVAPGTGKFPLTLGVWQPVDELIFDGGANFPIINNGQTIFVTVIFTIGYTSSALAAVPPSFEIALSRDIGPDWDPNNIGTVYADTTLQPDPKTDATPGESGTVTCSFQVTHTGDGVAHTLSVVIFPTASAVATAFIQAASPGAYAMVAFIPTDGFVP